jgi:cysteinyl-tRNA synthetase
MKMSLMIHNNLTNKKEEFVTVEPGKVSMYVCGVTVYDDIHMGHARSIIVFDMIARYLRYCGYEIKHITNFTDVDDKIIIKANKEGIEPLELSKRYIDEYFKDTEKLGVNRADEYPKASECMGNIIAMVKKIVDNGYGYVTPDGSVYFSVRKAKNYGQLSNRKIEDMESSGRVALDDQKQDPLDFAIWKAAKPEENCSWPSPWGEGRPGWHIECSAMIKRYLGDTIDIHGGGNDLIFPHHENEILQSEAANGVPLAHYWMHNGMLQVKGVGNYKEEKMSKSLGNFFRVKDVAQKFDKYTIRFYFLNTHYSSPLLYGEDMLLEAQTALKRLHNNYGDLQAYARSGPDGDGDVCDIIDGTRQRFKAAMDDDFNTRAAIEELFQLARTTNKAMADKTLTKQGAAKILALMKELDTILGILPEEEARNDDAFDAVMSILVDLRKELRARKQYDLSDMIRDKLAEAGYKLEDSADGAKWKKI